MNKEKEKSRFYLNTRELKNGCIVWIGAKSSFGYGNYYSPFHGKQIAAHRLAWEMENKRTIPKGKLIRHTCDNPSCVNPEHLKLGTQKKNMEDMRIKNRAGKKGGRQKEYEDLINIEISIPAKFNNEIREFMKLRGINNFSRLTRFALKQIIDNYDDLKNYFI